jgi:hypothetical protein
MAKRSAKVAEIKGLTRGLPDSAIENIGIEPLKDLHRQFGTLKDARFQPFVEHLLSDIVMIALIAVMAEADEWKEILADTAWMVRLKAEAGVDEGGPRVVACARLIVTR